MQTKNKELELNKAWLDYEWRAWLGYKMRHYLDTCPDLYRSTLHFEDEMEEDKIKEIEIMYEWHDRI